MAAPYERFTNGDDDGCDTTQRSEGALGDIAYSVRYLHSDYSNDNELKDSTPSKRDGIFPILFPPKGDPSSYVNDTVTDDEPRVCQVHTSDTVQNGEVVVDVSTITRPKKRILAPVQNPPPDYLVCSVFIMLFCCPLFGIYALHQSLASRKAAEAGHRGAAKMASKSACNAMFMGFLFGILIEIVVVVALIETFG
ncbi:uncharacterized protein LOC144345984 [Saccoglossus kowalevskii]